ncbi:hypothetical protein A5634_13390 [Mycobacterium asiaticum]|uniref:PPE family domain-containing protein n=1 Tax=Mycobacterium asiaticum TaxID=1790 RepID=A0A1A3PEG0_MYCAS|nr:PPE family protein [Mycobacterium asiaticum]OBK31679.1 hypothetical protein A5634_13390 [Mycobacterium asiaticum]
MVSNFAVLPPEINSARVYTGAGPAPMLAAAAAWDGLAIELETAAASFESIVTGLASGSWQGQASLAMAGAAAPYITWLNTTATHAQGAAGLVRSAVAEFETAMTATVHPALVAANRTQVMSLAASNVFGQNTPAIAAIESLYEQMWAQDVAAMSSYHVGASAVAAQLAPWHQQLQGLFNAAARSAAQGSWAAPESRSVMANSAAAVTIAEVMGGSGTPIPSALYVQRAFELYVHHLAPSAIARSLFTPEGLYPIIAIKNLTFDSSVAQGLAILDNTIRSHLAAGNAVSVFGYSQSATIASLEMARLAASVNPPTPDQLSFTLIGNPNNPNGGVAARFPNISFPSLGVTSSPATPDNLYPTRIYTIEYDGIADFPRYPLNLVSTLNALAGTYYLHLNYFTFTPDQIDAAIPLTNTVGPTMTEYYILPTKNLPLLEPVRAIPIIGDPIADLVQPNLRVIVNLGYGDPAYGYSTSPPNVPTPFGVFPEVDPMVVANALAAGTQQGINDFGYSMAHLDVPSVDLANWMSPGSSGTGGGGGGSGGGSGGGTSAPAITIDSVIDGIQTVNTDILNTVTKVAGTGYQVLLPTADVVNALITTVPSYNVNLFLEGIRELAHGDPMGLINTIGYPLAADVTLLTVAATIELFLVISAAQMIGADISALIT